MSNIIPYHSASFKKLLYFLFITFILTNNHPYCKGKEESMESNPVVIYLGALNDLMITNKKVPRGKAKINKNTLKILSAFLFHEKILWGQAKTENYGENHINDTDEIDDVEGINQDVEDILLTEEREMKIIHLLESLSSKNKKSKGKREKKYNIKKKDLYQGAKKKKLDRILDELKHRVNHCEESQDGALESLIENNYFSLFTQKVLFIQYYNAFLQREDSQILNGLMNIMESNYNNNKYLLLMKLLLITSYYEDLSREAYNNDIHNISYCQSLCNEILEEMTGNAHSTMLYDSEYNLFTQGNIHYIKRIKYNLEMIFFQKEVFKYKNMIKHGQIDTGLSLFRNVLIRIRGMLYKKYFNKFSPPEMGYWGKRMELMEPKYYVLFNPVDQNIINIDSPKDKIFRLKKTIYPFDMQISILPIVDMDQLVDREILMDHGIISGFQQINLEEGYGLLEKVSKIMAIIQKLKKDPFYKIYNSYCKDFYKITKIIGIKSMMNTTII